MDQKDDLIKINGVGELVFLKHNRSEQWKNVLIKHTNDNLYIMNKRALDRNYADLLKGFEGTEIDKQTENPKTRVYNTRY